MCPRVWRKRTAGRDDVIVVGAGSATVHAQRATRSQPHLIMPVAIRRISEGAEDLAIIVDVEGINPGLQRELGSELKSRASGEEHIRAGAVETECLSYFSWR